MNAQLQKFCLSLHEIGCIKFGKFTLKNGEESLYYIDLRILISYPLLMTELCTLLHDNIIKNLKFDIICGVPYTALPFSTILSIKLNKPMVMRRKEPKAYGTKQLVEGIFQKGSYCLIIEDVISTGSSILETVEDIKQSNMIVKDVIVVVNREEQDAVELLKQKGFNVHCLLSLSEIVSVLRSNQVISYDAVRQIELQRRLFNLSYNLIKKSTLENSKINLFQDNRLKMSYEERIKYCGSPVAMKLFSLMAEKKTNLCFAADVVDINELLLLADKVGPHICILKLHIDVLSNYSEKEKNELKIIATRHNFMIMEDRKLADIGNTVQMQFNQITKWANLVTAHSLPGFRILEAIKQSKNYNDDIGVFLIAELSSENNLITSEYIKKTGFLAEKYSTLVAGMICQNYSAVPQIGLIQITPGVNLEKHVKSDHLGQRYSTPEDVITVRGADIAVVGRGILNSDTPVQRAEEYKTELWNAYLRRIK